MISTWDFVGLFAVFGFILLFVFAAVYGRMR